jgi:hypothetical protein
MVGTLRFAHPTKLCCRHALDKDQPAIERSLSRSEIT